jgi:hypothetical protein
MEQEFLKYRWLGHPDDIGIDCIYTSPIAGSGKRQDHMDRKGLIKGRNIKATQDLVMHLLFQLWKLSR